MPLAILGERHNLRVGRGAMEMFGESHYQRAYQRGLTWADDVFQGWLRTGRPVPRELPLTKHDASAVLEEAALVDHEKQARVTSVLYATARVRWRRLVSREFTRRAS
jgi:hypothetical protein